MIRAKGITKIFGDNPEAALALMRAGRSKDEIRAETGQTVGVNNVSFDLQAGEFFVIMGLSGSGKSTLLRCINRLIEPSSGRVFLDTDDGEVEITALPDGRLREIRNRQMSMVFQRFALFPHMKVLDNAAYGLEVQGRPKKERRRIAQETLELVGLGEWGSSYPSELSGGMQQRVGLARALATEAKVLLMDEPFSALDPLIKVQMQNEMIGIQDQLARTILFITHDLDEALRLGDRIAIMEDGRIVQIGTPEDIIVNPRTEYVADFVEHADPTGVMTAMTVALPLTHSRIVKVKQEGKTDYYAHKALPGVFFGVGPDGSFEEMVVNGTPVTTRPLQEVLDTEEQPEIRKNDLALVSGETATLRQVLRGRTYTSLPTPVVSASGELRGIVTERELIEGILEKRGQTEDRPQGATPPLEVS